MVLERGCRWAEAQRFHLKRGAAVATDRAASHGAQCAQGSSVRPSAGSVKLRKVMGGCTLVTMPEVWPPLDLSFDVSPPRSVTTWAASDLGYSASGAR